MYFAIGVGHGKGELSPRKRQGTDSPFDGKVETGYRCREAKWTEAGLEREPSDARAPPGPAARLAQLQPVALICGRSAAALRPFCSRSAAALRPLCGRAAPSCARARET